MTEYEKLTVAKLREELTKRGLPKTGLKAVLIQRLVEADEESRQSDPAPSDAEPKPAESIDPEGTERQEHSSGATTEDQQKSPPSDPPLEATSAVAQAEQNHVSKAEREVVNSEATDDQVNGSEPKSQTEAVDASLDSKASDHGLPTAAQSSDALQAEREADIPQVTTVEAENAAQSKDAPVLSRQESLNNEEVLEDMKKRKRRSTTPALSAESVQKKVKLGDAKPAVKLPEDTNMEDVIATPATNDPVKDIPKADEAPERQDIAVEDAPAVETVGVNGKARHLVDQTKSQPVQEPKEDPLPKSLEPDASEAKAEPSTIPAQSPTKPSPADARFRNILTISSSGRDSSPSRPASKIDTEERIVSPALHPATTALYIRNIQRPLNVENFKDHLIELATPSDTSPDPAIIANIFFDSIRTHSLARFTTVAAASRVRTGLHDRVWPEEKNRKPLWVDFVPEEKLPKWLEVENSSSRRGQAAKRWEVVYENGNDGVKAYLQEVGAAFSGGASLNANKRNPQAPASGTDPGPALGVRGAPSGPRSNRERAEQLNDNRGRGFQALDDLFRSTAAKPKLYFLPVPKRTVER
ncbi:MAG: hypothetical protein Q9170_000214, partial [Blastenia crenularia]